LIVGEKGWSGFNIRIGGANEHRSVMEEKKAQEEERNEAEPG
jgi:hypothetical protein